MSRKSVAIGFGLPLAALLLGNSCGGGSSAPSTSIRGPARGSVTISWTAPTQNTDGTALTDLSGYRVLYGTSPDALTQSVEVAGSSVTATTIDGLTPGTYYVAVAAVNAAGLASDPSKTVSVTIH
jgi:predicted phage tail protein